MLKIKSFIVILLVAYSGSTLGDDALDIINRDRSAVGLLELGSSPALTQAAINHAKYLSYFDSRKIKSVDDAHGERRAKRGFTGKTVADRVKHEGYPHQHVSENISLGNGDKTNSIELLMSGIYHRFGFLSFSISELGYGIVDRIYVYNMGRTDLSAMCANPPKKAIVKTPTDCLGTVVEKSFWDKLCANMTSDDLYAPPYKTNCANGILLDRDYMQGVCRNPPQEALLQGGGSYYNVCDNKTKIKAEWLDGLCANPSTKAKYIGDGRYFEICDDERKVHAFWLEDVCSSVPEEDKYTDSGQYYSSCANAPYQIRKEYIQQLDDELYEANPEYIVWPAPNMENIDVAFYNEIPDPLPDLKSSGYPFSVQFNPGKVDDVEILQANIAYQKSDNSWQSIKKVREVNAKTDPHKKLSKLEFAWFPLDKLKSGTMYRVEIQANIDGVLENIEWKFKTKPFFSF